VSRGADPYRLGRVGPGFSLDSLKVVVSGLHADTTGLLMRGSEDE